MQLPRISKLARLLSFGVMMLLCGCSSSPETSPSTQEATVVIVNGKATSIQDTTSLLPALGMSDNDLAEATEVRLTLESAIDLRPVLFLGYAQDATVEGNGPPTRVGTLVAADEEEGQSYPRFFLRQEGYSAHTALSLKGGVPAEIIIHFERHIDKPTPRALVLMSTQYLEDNSFRGFSHFFSGLFQGMIWVLILYHLLLYQSVRETSYLWYCVYMASISALTLGDLGYWQTGLFKNHPVLGWHLYQAMQYVTGILTLVFMRSFVQLKRLSPRWDLIVQRFIAGNLIALALLGLVLFFTSNGLALVFAKILIIPFAAFGLWVCWVLFRSGDTVARYFAVAGCITAVAVAVNAGAEFFFAAVTVTENTGVKLNLAEQIPGTDFTRFYWVHGAVILHLLTFAMGMGHRRRQNDLELQRTREIDEMKTRFYTNITHEFRTPLTVILGMVDQITTQPKQSSLIKRNAQQLLRLINQLLGLSRLEAKQVRAEYEYGEVISYLKYLSESFHSLAKDKGVKLTFYSEIPELEMDYDSEKLQQIVYNLLSNAIKFTAENGQVVLHLQKLETEGHHQLQIKVSDTGVGIPQEALPKIFDRFYQVDGSSTREGEGTGVGLAFTQGLVRLLDGQIEVSSEVGKGTSFTVSLPVKNDFSDKPASTDFTPSEVIFAPAVPHPNSLASPEASTKRTNSESRIAANDKPLLLLIDDNADVLEYLVSLLAGEHQLLQASNGKDGFTVATEQTPDLIISDVMMPQMNGYELCELLKSNLRTSHIPVILLTAKVTQDDKIAGLASGADAFLTKPFDKRELLIRIDKLLKNRQLLQQYYGQDNIPVIPDAIKPDLEAVFLQQLEEAIREHLDDPEFGVPELAKEIFLSQSQMYRKLKAITGKTPSQFIRSYRLKHGRKMLAKPELSIADIAYSIGFADPNYFSRTFNDEFGSSPSDWRKKRGIG